MRRLRLLLIGLPLALVLADAGLWFVATRALASGLAHWRTRMQAEGWTVTDEGQSLGGFPFSATLALTGARIEGGTQAMPGGLAWQASRVVLSVSAAAPFRLAIAPDGEQQLRLANAPRLVFHADRMEATLPLGRWRTMTATLAAEGLAGGIAANHHPQDVRVDSVSLRFAEQPAPGQGVQAALSLHARQIELPDTGRWPMGAVIGEADAALAATLPRLTHDAPRAQAAASWRDSGGHVTLQQALLKWGPMTLTGNAELTLDKNLQPAGHGVAVLEGGEGAFDALVSGGALQQGVGATAKAVLSVMAQLPGGNGVRLPFTLRDSTLSVGPIPIARLKDVVW